jgi:phosphoribosylglycinamide formyltransferase-1
MKNIVILISGRGSNMEAVVRAAKAEQWPARVAAVISNRADAPGLAFAAEHGIKTAVVASKNYANRADFDAALQTVIDGFEPDLVVLAGFMRILTAQFVAHYAGRMLNIHPSLLPLFPGLATHAQALGRQGGRAWRDGAFRNCRTRSRTDGAASRRVRVARRYG